MKHAKKFEKYVENFKRRWDIDIKVALTKTWCEDVDWIQVAQHTEPSKS
jgi:hypothetical protein